MVSKHWSHKDLYPQKGTKTSRKSCYQKILNSFLRWTRKENASEEEKQFFEDIYNLFKIEWTPTIEWIRNGKIYKKYQFLDENYIKIKDRQQQKQRREEFLIEFEKFMLNYEEECYEKMS